MGGGVSLAAIAHGATIIEKHFVLSKSGPGIDAGFSLDPDEMRLLVDESKRAWESLGKVSYGCSEVEIPAFRRRRSIYATKDIREGEKLSMDNVRVIRPSGGLAPKNLSRILGRKATRDIHLGEPISWNQVS